MIFDIYLTIKGTLLSGKWLTNKSRPNKKGNLGTKNRLFCITSLSNAMNKTFIAVNILFYQSMFLDVDFKSMF